VLVRQDADGRVDETELAPETEVQVTDIGVEYKIDSNPLRFEVTTLDGDRGYIYVEYGRDFRTRFREAFLIDGDDVAKD